MRIGGALVLSAAVVGTILIVKVPDWTGPRTPATQMGYRASSMVQFEPRAQAFPVNAPAPIAPPLAADRGPPATERYKNLKVLTGLSVSEFDQLQQAITQWIAPKQGCAFCHDEKDLSSDAKPQKLAARRMLEMTRYVNSAWKSHVEPSGVTCYTCHRGQPVPAEVWWPHEPKPQKPFVGRTDDWNEASNTVYGFFPTAGFAEYYLEDNPISAQSPSALPTGAVANAAVVRRVYEMMMQMSVEIGVNCGFCHNSRALQDWKQSTPERWVGYHALRMIRDINRNHLLPLADVIPQERRIANVTSAPVIPARQTGQQPGNGLATCGTCHYGLPKPLGAANLVKNFPALVGDAPPSPDADPNFALTRAALKDMQKPDLGATDSQTGAMR